MEIQPKIKVIGVGTCGNSVLNRLIDRGLNKTICYAVEADSGILALSRCENKLQLLHEGTYPLASTDLESYDKIALENKDRLAGILKGANMVVIIAGMGGVVGTSTAPLISAIARENDILNIAAVYTPFAFEGKKRYDIAQIGLKRLKESANTTVVIPNEKAEWAFAEMSAKKAVMRIDDVMCDAVNTLISTLIVPGVINLSLEDVEIALKESGDTFFGVGTASGSDKAAEAVKSALCCPFSSTTFENAKGMLLSAEGGDDMTLDELYQIVKYASAATGNSADILFAANMRSELNGKIKVSVLATK